MVELFGTYSFDDAARSRLDADGHVVFPELLTDDARAQLTTALAGIQALLPGDEQHRPNHYSAEYDLFLASLIRHPQLLALARAVLGEKIRFDHCVALNRPGGNDGTSWHSHAYAEGDPHLGFLRIFFYVNGFVLGDGNLKVVPGSHLCRDAEIRAATDIELQQGWMQNRVHPVTGAALQIEPLAAPPGSVALMWTHAAHGVNPRRAGSATRWSVVYAYRNPGAESHARWLTPGFEQSMAGTDGLMSLY